MLKRKFIILFFLCVFISLNLFSLKKWLIEEIKIVDYSKRYPIDTLKFRIYFLRNEKGKLYRGISADREKFKKFKKGDVVNIYWDQKPDIPRDLLHTVYTLYPKYLDKSFEKALIIIGDIEYAK